MSSADARATSMPGSRRRDGRPRQHHDPWDDGKAARTETDVNDYEILREKLGPDGLEELRRLIGDEIARRPARQEPPPPARPGTVPGPDEDLRPRS